MNALTFNRIAAGCGIRQLVFRAENEWILYRTGHGAIDSVSVAECSTYFEAIELFARRQRSNP